MGSFFNSYHESGFFVHKHETWQNWFGEGDNEIFTQPFKEKKTFFKLLFHYIDPLFFCSRFYKIHKHVLRAQKLLQVLSLFNPILW